MTYTWSSRRVVDKMFVTRLSGVVMVVAISLGAVHALDTYAQTDEAAVGIPVNGAVVVGGLFPLTGEISSGGAEGKAAIELGIRDFNSYLRAQGAGWQLVMVAENTATDPAVALTKIKALHEKGITTILGPMASANVERVKDYADHNDMLVLSCCSSAPELAIAGDSVYRLVPDDMGTGAAVGKLLADSGIEVLVPIWRGETLGDGIWKSVTHDFESRGGVVHAGVRYSPVTQDLLLEVAVLNKYVRETVNHYGANKVAVMMISFDESVRLARAASLFDTLDDVRWFASESVSLTDSLTNDRTASGFAGMVNLTMARIATIHGEQYERVTATLAEELGWDPHAIAYPAYDSVWLVGKSIIESNSTNATEIRGVLPAVAAGYSGALHSTKLNDAGDLLPTDRCISRIIDGVWTDVGMYSAATDTLTLDGCQQ